MEKTHEQLGFDVRAAVKRLSKSRRFRFGLNAEMAMFEMLQSKFGWSDDNFRRYYPEATIAAAVAQGWHSGSWDWSKSWQTRSQH